MTRPIDPPEERAEDAAATDSAETLREESAPTIFSDALEVRPEDRDTFLDQACGDDQALRTEVDSLLRAHAAGDAFLNRPLQILSPGALLTEFFGDAPAGFQVGAYRVLRLLAMGGMGAVYLGERVDEAFHKQVAIKLIRAERWGSDTIERFRVERQVLADLEHPGIARLIDGGSTPDGLPYLVMEYVDGVALNQYSEEQHLDLPARLALFLEVCAAVQYAHQNLVIHRDLKPSNILVDRSGRVKLLDFGIAKVLDAGAAGSVDLTATSVHAMTPRYASPEQMLGRRMTTATDVYSLGVVLYELITGGFPYDLESKSATEISRTIAETPPTRPSRRVAPPLSRRLTGDLDTIVLKALHKEPARRFATVEDFAADIRRHLVGLPVQARPDTAGYRISKFVARNKALVASTVAVILLLATALVITLAAYRQAEAARRSAEQQAYMASLVAAESALLSGQVAEAAVHLEAAPLRLRSWEWHHLHARLDRSLETFRAHAKGITRIVFLPDGERFVTTSIDSTLRVWKGMSGEREQEYGPFSSELESVVLLPGTETLAVGLNDGSVLLVNQADRSTRTLSSPGRGWAFLSASPDASRLACGTFDGHVRVWSMPAGSLVADWQAHHALAFPTYSPDGRLLATGGGEGGVTLYDARSLRRVQDLGTHTRRVYYMAWSPDGSKLVSGSMDQTANLWDVRKRTLLRTFREHRATVGAILFHPDWDCVLTAGADNRLLLWSTTSGAVVGEFRGHIADVTALAARPDGSGVITGDWDGLVKSWEWGTQDVRSLRVDTDWNVPQVFQAAWNKDETLLTCATNSGFLPSWWRTGHRAHVYRPKVTTRRVALDPDLSTLVAVNDFGDIELYHPADSTAFRVVRAHRAPILGLAADWKGRRIATTSADSTVKLWSYPELQLIRSFLGHQGAVNDVEFSPAGDLLASCGADGAIRLWDPASGRALTVLKADDAEVADVTFDASGARLAAASRNGALRIWDLPEGRLAAGAMRGRGAMTAVAWSEDGTRLAAAGADAIVRIFDPVQSREIMALHGHVAGVTSLRFGRGDASLTSTSLDGTVRVWERGPLERSAP